jgi:hypothetical protein
VKRALSRSLIIGQIDATVIQPLSFKKQRMTEKNLATLIRNMNPVLQKQSYVFCSLSKTEYQELKGECDPLCVFHESESTTMILEISLADKYKIGYQETWSQITCEIHSDLTAVGFLAAMCSVLAEKGIAVNAISAYHHDHLFVPSNRASEALVLLKAMSENHSG